MSAAQAVPATLFEQAIAIADEGQRAAYLDRVCGTDAELRRQAERLVNDHFLAGNFLDQPAISLDITCCHSAERPGSQIGPYKLLEQIGEGGMGLVYMAEQQRPVKRLVALKLVKPGMDSKQVIARFEAERQALAMMDHPHIAKVLDAGTTDAGRPYFAMDLVRGLPINEFCDQKRLTVRQRLELFVDVCQAVQHAHQKGVIHRDLKPTNVLVTMHDSLAVPKVIDFGIAKALGQSLTEHTLHTGFAQLVGTPLYMSPEQAEFNQLGVDTRSDVYSLGVLLYELLTGTTPFDKDRLKSAGFDEIRRIIREEEPETISARIAKTKSRVGSAHQIAASNPQSAIRIPQLSELDWIVMKALEKDRSDRYESASSLARDIERFLNDEPVQACPPTAAYRFRKFARKHRAALSTGLLVAASLLIGIILSTWQAVRATTAEAHASFERTQAQQQRDEAQRQRAQAQVQRNQAQQQRDEVRALNDQLRQTLYVAHVNLANNAWQSGGAGRMRELLEPLRPKRDEADLRGFEWHYLYRLCHSELLTLRTARWNLAYSPDGKRLASGSRIWEAETGRELLTFSGGGRDELAFSPDGKWLAGAPGTPRELKVWDAQTGKELLTLKDAVNCVAYSPDGRRLASASRDNGVNLWDAQTGEKLLTLRGHTGTVRCVAFSHEGKTLASGSTDKTVKIWSVETGEPRLTFQEHTDSLESIAFSPDDRRLASTADDKTAKVWDAQTGQLLVSFRTETASDSSVAFSPDGTRLATADVQSVKVSDAQTGEELLIFHGHTDWVGDVAFSPDGKRLASASWDGTVRVWNVLAVQKPLLLQGLPSTFACVAYSPDGKRIATGGPTNGSEEYPPQELNVWDTATGQRLLTLKAKDNPITSLAFSPNGKWLAASCGENDIWPAQPGEILLWDALTGKELTTIKHTVGLYGVSFSPDGKRIAAGSAFWDKSKNTYVGGHLKVWDPQSGVEQLSLRGHTHWINSVAFSPDGKRLVSASADKTVKLWDAQTGKELVTFKGHARSVDGVTFSPDSKRLASASEDNKVNLWDAQTGQPIRSLKGHTHYVTSVVFSPDGQRLASTSDDKTVKVWNPQTGEELLSLKGPANRVTFSPEGNQLLAVSPDGRLTIYDATPLTNGK